VFNDNEINHKIFGLMTETF